MPRTTALLIVALAGTGCYRDAAVPDAPNTAAPPTTLLDCRAAVFGEVRHLSFCRHDRTLVNENELESCKESVPLF